MSLTPLIDLLRTRIGLDPQSLGANALPGIIAARMRFLELDDPWAYADRLASSPTDFDDLVNDVVVSETWFYRGGQLFAVLAGHVRKTAAARAPDRPFRILSVPCSSGEEPYSMAMALADADVPRTLWTLDAVDLSPRNLERAQRGRYGSFAFRETPDAVRRRYFREVEGGWEIDPALRAAVCFRQGNLLDPQLFAGAEQFDLIFCRNLLIYLHAEARVQVVAALERLLARGGLMCMGHAEPLTLLGSCFRLAGPPAHFLFQRSEEKTMTLPGHFPRPNALPPPSPRRNHPTFRAAAETPQAPAAPADLLAKARRQADAGDLQHALLSCQVQLSEAGPSAELYSLMGVIHQARRNETEAAACFRKALYLEPDHGEALMHLMLLYRQSGDEPAAALLRRRLERKSTGIEP